MRPHSVLDEASKIIGERGMDYGDIEDNFANIAAMFNIATGQSFSPWDVAMMMVCLKLARIRQSEHKRDNYVDLINYCAFACEIAGAK